METNEVGGKLNILVAEGDELNRILLCEILEKYGCTYKAADNGRTAIDLFLKEHFDIVFLDLHMPVMDGYEAARAIREIESEGFGHTPIAVLSASIHMDEGEKAFAGEMDYYLMKPYSPEEVYRLLDSLSGDKTDLPAATRKTDAGSRIFGHLTKGEMCRTFEKMDCDADFFTALIEKFKASSAELITGIRTSISENNCEALIQYAHALKGEFHIFNAAVPVRITEALETAVRTGCMPESAEAVIAKLEEDIRHIIESYTEFLNREK